MIPSSLINVLADFGPSLGVVAPFLPVPLLAVTLLVMSQPSLAFAVPRVAIDRRRQILAIASAAGPARAAAMGAALVVFTAFDRLRAS